MARKKKGNKEQSMKQILKLDAIFNEKFNFITGLLLLFLAIYLIVAFISYFSTGSADQSLVTDLRPGELENTNRSFENYCGSTGAILSYFFISRCFGFAAFTIPLFIILCGLKLIGASTSLNLWKWFFSLSVITVWSSITLSKFLSPLMSDAIFSPGGDHGVFVAQWIENIIGPPGLIAVLTVVALIFLTFVSSETIIMTRKILNPMGYLKQVKFTITNRETSDSATPEEEIATQPDPEVFDDPAPQIVEFTDNGTVVNAPAGIPTSDDVEMTIEVGEENDKAEGNRVSEEHDLNTPINPKEPFTRYKYPTLDLLKKYDNDGKPYIDRSEQEANKNQIIKVLNSFGVQISEIKATVGPTITLYEITPAEGVRISKIRNLEDDIALSLAALGIRIIAPIPGKGTIGIEVPNAKANIVSMESILNSRKFQESQMELPIALGKTITNDVYMVDLAKIPHLLVAGATGQGKSVGLNAIITSLLYKKHPNELKLVLIDPKKVEFSIYTPIAKHFMAMVDENEEPIITDIDKVVRTLKSLCTLMDYRYDMLKLAGTRNIKEYNNKYVNHLLDLSKGHEYMPYIVVIIDEFGDLIMQVGKEIELPIARIAQLARAVGIHMVIATQRPTTSIITGNIKANFPGRMAFKVSAMIDSRTILDRPGAQQLIGRGDMLILNGSEPVRVQCAFIDTPEVEVINKYISQQPGPTHALELPEPITEDNGGGGGAIELGSFDPLFEEAARMIVLSQQGSTSMIQRKFQIGYNRAGRLMDQLEQAGIVGAAQGSKPREVLIPDEVSLEKLLGQLHL